MREAGVINNAPTTPAAPVTHAKPVTISAVPAASRPLGRSSATFPDVRPGNRQTTEVVTGSAVVAGVLFSYIREKLMAFTICGPI